jgi:hypothetical protein
MPFAEIVAVPLNHHVRIAKQTCTSCQIRQEAIVSPIVPPCIMSRQEQIVSVVTRLARLAMELQVPTVTVVLMGFTFTVDFADMFALRKPTLTKPLFSV